MMIMTLFQYLASKMRSEEGAAMVEYGVLVAGIAAVVVATVFLIGPPVQAAFQAILNEL